jgi:hypothetical protein
MVFQLTKKTNLIWFVFWGASFATIVVYRFFWFLDSYWVCLAILGIINIFIASMIFRVYGVKSISISLVLLGLILGQWWFWEFIFVSIIWQLRGVAP